MAHGMAQYHSPHHSCFLSPGLCDPGLVCRHSAQRWHVKMFPGLEAPGVTIGPNGFVITRAAWEQ